MKITWYGHSCFRLETGNSVILIDPFLKGNPTFEKSGIAWDEATAGVTHVALTHGHSDHVGDAVEVCKKRSALTEERDALRKLESFDPRQSQVVELRFFGGLTVREISSAMGISPATVQREWALAKIWLHRELSRPD